MKFTVYTDGSGTREGPGGIAYVALNEDGTFHSENSLPLTDTTNQRAEILAAALALHELPARSEVLIVSDSDYVVQAIRGRLARWQGNGWRTKDMKPVANQAHWRRLLQAMSRHAVVSVEWCEGHSGIEWNERADELAGAARRRQIEQERSAA